MDNTLTEDWLRDAGFKWEQFDRQPSKHWVLSIATACIDPHEKGRRMWAAPDDLRIEVAYNDGEQPYWFCWLRSDFAGRYARLIHLRHITTIKELVTIIEAVTGRDFVSVDCLYGMFHAPENAANLRKESQRLDKRLQTAWHNRVDAEKKTDTSDTANLQPL